MLEPNTFADFVARIRSGDEQAAVELVRQYEPLIRREVRVHLDDQRLNRVFDSMDICQSVLASFFVHTATGAYDLDEPGQLVRLLVTMARNKLASAARKQYRQRRDSRRTTADGEAIDRTAANESTPSEQVAGKELLQQFRARLTDEERQLADLRADGMAWGGDLDADGGERPKAAACNWSGQSNESSARWAWRMPMSDTSDPAAEFSRLCRTGSQPEIDSFLARYSPLSSQNLVAILRIDQRERWRNGEHVSAESYFKRYPAVRADADLAVDLVYNEYLLGAPENPTLVQDLARQYPDLAETLAAQIQFHEAMTPCPVTPQPGPLPQQFGRYAIKRLLGRGGMGTVYLARDAQLDRLVALKVPNFDADPAQTRQFLREARAAAALHHPNICAVFDSGEIDGRPFLTMAFIDGESLSARINRGPVPIDDAVALVRTLAEALDEAHRAGVVHRDLKPGNILFNNKGQPVITDFGLARRTTQSVGETTSQQGFVGTPAYMAPEQVNGDTSAIGPATDIYSLGVMLYEMLTGRRPFDGPLGTMLARITTDDPEPPSRLRPEVNWQLDAVCREAMAKKPVDRFPSMAAFASALGGGTTIDKPSVRKTRPTWWMAAPASAFAILLCLLLIWQPWKAREKAKVEPEGPTPRPVIRDSAGALAIVDRAWELNDRDETGRAIQECNRALDLDDRCVTALICRANAFIKQKKYDAAISDLNLGMTIDPDNPMLYVDRAWAYNQKGEYDLALADADRVVGVDEVAAEALYQRGSARFGQSKYHDAVADFTAAIKIKEDYEWAYRERAKAYRALGDDTRAEADIKKADEIAAGKK